jgi:hypothetical protein
MFARQPVPCWDRDSGDWSSAAELRKAQKLAIAITGPQVRLIDELTRHCEDALRKGRPDMAGGHSWDAEQRRQKLVRDLYERAGAASADDGDLQTVPLTLEEIRIIEKIRNDIRYFTDYYMHDRRDPMLSQADDLINQLHFLAGRARATGDSGGVIVFAGQRALPGS